MNPPLSTSVLRAAHSVLRISRAGVISSGAEDGVIPFSVLSFRGNQNCGTARILPKAAPFVCETYILVSKINAHSVRGW